MAFGNLTDDFFVNLNIQTTMGLPTARETVLNFFESMQKEFPGMTTFFRRDPTGEFVLEGDREAGQYQWAEIHPNRLCAGVFNPPSMTEAYALHRWILERSIYYLGLGPLDIEALDLLFGFNLDYVGNRNQIVAEALLGHAPLGAFLQDPSFKAVEFEPSMVFALDEQCARQARLAVESRCSDLQVRSNQFDDEPISVYLTVREYPQPGRMMDPLETFRQQCELCEDLTGRIVAPQIIRPIAEAIATAQ